MQIPHKKRKLFYLYPKNVKYMISKKKTRCKKAPHTFTGILSGFRTADIFKSENTIIVHFRIDSKEVLENYAATHCLTSKTNGLDQFKNQVKFTTRVLNHVNSIDPKGKRRPTPMPNMLRTSFKNIKKIFWIFFSNSRYQDWKYKGKKINFKNNRKI